MPSTRTRRNPADRATEDVAVAQRIVDRLTTKAEGLEADALEVRGELEQAHQRLAYARQNPALPKQAATGEAATRDLRA